MPTNQSIVISINTLEEALNIENVAALNITKYKQNSVEGQENLQSSFIRMWRDIHKQAGEVLETFKLSEEQSV